MEVKNNPQSASVIKCVTPGCHSLPLTGRHTYSWHNAVTQPFFHFSLTALLGRGEHSGRRAGGTCRKEKGSLYCRCQHQQHPEPVSRQRCCLSFNRLSVCSTPQKKETGQELAEWKPGRVVPF